MIVAVVTWYCHGSLRVHISLTVTFVVGNIASVLLVVAAVVVVVAVAFVVVTVVGVATLSS